MVIETEYVILGAVFICAILLIEGLYYLIQDSTQGRMAANRRMKMLDSGVSPREVYQVLRRDPRADLAKYGAVGRPLRYLDRLLSQSGLTISFTRAIILIAAFCGLVIFGLFWAVARIGTLPPIVANPVVLVIVGVTLGIVISIMFLSRLAKKRMQLFSEQLPDSLDIMVRSLQAGHPVATAMALVTKEMRDPIGSEFGLAVDEMTYGLDMRDALENMGQRVNHPEVQDFQYVLVSINIQHDTGGNLAETLAGLSHVIRQRFQMFKKIRVLSAEGRLSAKILAVLPMLFVLMMVTGKPGFYTEVIEDPLFWPIVGIAVVLQLIGMYIMHKLVNFRV
ncbi:MAG: type II secretion system F family protein [Pseudomonadota bacterium]